MHRNEVEVVNDHFEEARTMAEILRAFLGASPIKHNSE